MRLFLAIELPDIVRAELVRVQDAIRDVTQSAASFTRESNLHLTIKFLGDTDDKTLAALCESLSHVRSPGEMRLQCARLECFPPRGPIRVIAAAVDGDVAQLRSLHESIEQRCKFLGFAQETRTFRPHATLARAKGVMPSSTRDKLAELGAPLFPSSDFVAKEFVLFESKLKPTGSEYIPLAKFPL